MVKYCNICMKHETEGDVPRESDEQQSSIIIILKFFNCCLFHRISFVELRVNIYDFFICYKEGGWQEMLGFVIRSISLSINFFWKDVMFGLNINSYEHPGYLSPFQ